ncbi:MAG: CubicO group peptidase (beta-lactamase class C family) [Candidatus Azotimanducaceae bacterium]|jgi:CubicO group peptidase (beta-lactamase class C family)
MYPLIELPKQPKNIEWPTESWSRAKMSGVSELGDSLFNLPVAEGVTYALLVVKGGELVYERYDAGANPIYLQYSWSMAKSIVQALVGILVRQGRIDIHAPANVPEWKNDSRKNITVDQLLRMSSGLKFNEDYVDGQASDVIPMLQFEGRHDTAAFAANMPLIHEPDARWSYASGTTNIICRILKDIVGGGASGMLRFMNDELFEPIGMKTASPKFDTSGTFVGSSFLFAIPQDFARFGMLYLRDGIWDGREILPRGWVDYARTPTYKDDEYSYGAHWWQRPDKPEWFYCGGYDGQRIICVPEKDVIIVRCGRTVIDEMPKISEKLYGIAGAL